MKFFPALIAGVMSLSLVGCVIPGDEIFIVDDGPRHHAPPPPPPHRPTHYKPAPSKHHAKPAAHKPAPQKPHKQNVQRHQQAQPKPKAHRPSP